MRVQRFSTDWHANSFAGSTVRKVTRGMWALDLLNDTILMALLPSLAVLLGSMIQAGRMVFDRVTFHDGGHREPLYDGLSVDIRAGERVGYRRLFERQATEFGRISAAE
jgi:hypothetical protein